MKRMMLIVTGFLACPCHFPLWLTLLGGSALGGVVMAHQDVAVVGMTVYFIAALSLGLHRPSRNRGDG